MANQTKYGVISDVHRDPRIVPAAISVLKSLGAEKLLVNGDIGNHQRTLEDSQGYVAFILDSIGKSGLESWVQPGSHESLLAYGPVIDHFSQKYGNVIDATKTQKVEQGDHHLVFLPGSDFLCGGEYQIGNHDQIPSGRYIQTEKGLMQFEEFEQYVGALQRGLAKGAMQYANMQDLRKLITAPEKTIVVCHVPRKFDGLETCVDMAEFGEATEDFNLQGEEVKKGSVYPIQVAPRIVQAGYPVQIKRENRGNEDLKTLYEELGVRKSVTGHFHESTHRANDRNGNHVNEGELVNELFWNSGLLDAGHTGILTVDGEKVSYQNVRLQEHLK
jgi:Icc-related predicted phosphoesterase